MYILKKWRVITYINKTTVVSWPSSLHEISQNLSHIRALHLQCVCNHGVVGIMLNKTSSYWLHKLDTLLQQAMTKIYKFQTWIFFLFEVPLLLSDWLIIKYFFVCPSLNFVCLLLIRNPRWPLPQIQVLK